MSKAPPRRRLRAIFLATCGLALAACSLAARAAETASPDPARFEQEIAAFESYDRKTTPPKSAILFVGSSSIGLWPTAESFPDLPVINRGFGGSHISDVNHFAERIVLKYNPRVIVFYAGDNDIAARIPPQRVADDYRQFVKDVHKRLPHTQIVYLPIKPSILRWKMWPEMQQANALIRSFSDSDERLAYIDTATPMLGSDGRPRPELFLDDGLHLNAAGYELWVGQLKPALESIDSAR